MNFKTNLVPAIDILQSWPATQKHNSFNPWKYKQRQTLACDKFWTSIDRFWQISPNLSKNETKSSTKNGRHQEQIQPLPCASEG